MQVSAKTLMIIALIVSSTSFVYAFAVIPSCTLWCFDLIKNAATKGFDPQFLAQDITKQTCKESHVDLQKVGMTDLNFCSKELGTLP